MWCQLRLLGRSQPNGIEDEEVRGGGGGGDDDDHDDDHDRDHDDDDDSQAEAILKLCWLAQNSRATNSTGQSKQAEEGKLSVQNLLGAKQTPTSNEQ